MLFKFEVWVIFQGALNFALGPDNSIYCVLWTFRRIKWPLFLLSPPSAFRVWMFCTVFGICMFDALVTVLKVRLGTRVAFSSVSGIFGNINCSPTVTLCKKCQVYFLGLIKSVFIIPVF